MRITLNVKPYSGTYEIDTVDEPFTVLEWRWIKKLSGYLPLTIHEGLGGYDPDAVLALAVVALVRAGRIGRDSVASTFSKLSESPFGDSTFLLELDADETEEDEDGPPAVPAETPETNSPSRSSGPSLRPISAPLEDDQRTTGTPDSGMSASSDPQTLAS